MGAFPGVKLTAQGAGAPIVINLLKSYSPYFSPAPSWSLGIVCTVSPGASLTYNVEVTCDQTPSAGGNWNSHDTLNGLTASANGNVAFPITGIRLNVTAYTSGSVNLGVAQWP